MAVIGAIIWLAVCSIFDIRMRKIPVWLLIVGLVWAIFCEAVRLSALVPLGQDNVWQEVCKAFISLLPGIFFVAASFLTEGKIGNGDGLILGTLGFMEGFGPVLFTCGIGLFLQSLVAVVLVIGKRADKQTKLPFVPFLFVARIIFLCR